MGARRGRRSTQSKLARMHDSHSRSVDAAVAAVDAERRAIQAHDRRALAAGIRGVGIITRGMAAPDVASVTRAPVGQWQAMAPDAPVSHSDARAEEWYRDRKRERAATLAANRRLAADRRAQGIQALSDAHRAE